MTHLAFDLRWWMEDKNKQPVLTLSEEKENVRMALKVQFTSVTCVSVECLQVDRWPVKRELMAK